jgi:hypothetical protein
LRELFLIARTTIIYGAGVTAASKIAGTAAYFIQFLIAPDTRQVWAACGFDPV